MSKSYFIMKKLIQKCFSGEFPPGTLLPGENELCVQFDMSRSSVRTALQTMASKGVISIIPKKGSIVNELTEWNWLDSHILEFFSQDNMDPVFIKNLLIARLTFEPNICAISAAVSDTADLIKIDEGYRMMAEGARQNKRMLFLEGDKRFHSAVVASCKNPFLSSLDGVLSTAMTLSFNQTLETDLDSSLPALDKHKTLFEAIRKRDVKQAREMSKKIILEAIKKTVVDKDGLPDEFIDNI